MSSRKTRKAPVRKTSSKAARNEPRPVFPIVGVGASAGGLEAFTRLLKNFPAAARPRRILVADDNVDAADSMAMLLQLAGHDVRVAHDGLAAVKVAEAFRPEIVVLDIGMPTLNGYEAARWIRKLDPAVRLVALSGYAQEEDRSQSKEAGFDLHLVKPVDTRRLRDFIAEPQRVRAGAGAR